MKIVLESKPTLVPEKKASDILIEEPDTLDENSLESKPTPVPEVETSQYMGKKIVRYTSDGRLATDHELEPV